METTITISDLNASTYSCTTSTAVVGTINITYVSSDAPITFTNS